MLMSELAARTGVPIPTVKFYLREGVLMPGRATSATRATYDETHIRRVALIRALSQLGLSMAQIRAIVTLIDEPGRTLLDTLATATALLPPAVDAAAPADYPRARAALTALHIGVPDDYPAVAQLEHALAAAEAAGMPMTEDRLRAYGPAVLAIAAYDIDEMPLEPPSRAIEYAVLGTALYEPVIAALRRVAHAELSARRLGADEPTR
ncbi:MerR family transcriptional regulator [Nocardia sp. NPDC005978]|uniref:MerR family transcriptional regulator n=1 Tax=unclassified Nocardia TaxID=2637762 RepID=UPI0033B9DC33